MPTYVKGYSRNGHLVRAYQRGLGKANSAVLRHAFTRQSTAGHLMDSRRRVPRGSRTSHAEGAIGHLAIDRAWLKQKINAGSRLRPKGQRQVSRDRLFRRYKVTK